jgi:hypothetical protein
VTSSPETSRHDPAALSRHLWGGGLGERGRRRPTICGQCVRTFALPSHRPRSRARGRRAVFPSRALQCSNPSPATMAPARMSTTEPASGAWYLKASQNKGIRLGWVVDMLQMTCR